MGIWWRPLRRCYRVGGLVAGCCCLQHFLFFNFRPPVLTQNVRLPFAKFLKGFPVFVLVLLPSIVAISCCCWRPYMLARPGGWWPIYIYGDMSCCRRSHVCGACFGDNGMTAGSDGGVSLQTLNRPRQHTYIHIQSIAHDGCVVRVFVEPRAFRLHRLHDEAGIFYTRACVLEESEQRSRGCTYDCRRNFIGCVQGGSVGSRGVEFRRYSWFHCTRNQAVYKIHVNFTYNCSFGHPRAPEAFLMAGHLIQQ